MISHAFKRLEKRKNRERSGRTMLFFISVFFFCLIGLVSADFGVMNVEPLNDSESTLRYLPVPSALQVGSAVFTFTSNYTPTHYVQTSADSWSSTTKYSNFPDVGIVAGTDYGLRDNVWDSYSGCGGMYACPVYHIFNFTRPENALNTSFLKINIYGSNMNITIPDSCWLPEISFKWYSYLADQSYKSRLYCFNGSVYDEVGFYQGKKDLNEYSMFWDVPAENDKLRVDVRISDSYAWWGLGNYSEGVTTSDLSRIINKKYNSGLCDCEDCAYVNSTCNIPFYFDFPEGGEVTYDFTLDLEIKYVSQSSAEIPQICKSRSCPAGMFCAHVMDCFPDPRYVVSEPIPPISKVIEVVRGGGSLSDSVRAYNPSMYPVVNASWNDLWFNGEISKFPSNLGDFLKNILKYVFRQPASLVVMEVEE